MSKIIYSTHFGSRLFGTSRPDSDTDIKHIELPDIQKLLIGRKIENRVVKTNDKESQKNGPLDVDIEYVPIQRLARDFYEGQTYALEIAFSAGGTHAEQTHYGPDGSPAPMNPNSDFCRFLDELKSQFLTSNINAMMGYVVNQANIYSFKGERLNAAKAARALILRADQSKTLAALMSDERGAFAQEARQVAAEHPDYFRFESYDVGAGKSAPCFKLLEKTLPWSVRASTASEVIAASVKKFGSRAKEASVDNVDWKATMHALRIVDEGIALLGTGRIELPHPPEAVARMLAIRRGEIPLDPLREEIDQKLRQLKALSAATALPEVSESLTARFDAWLESWMMRFYGLSATPEETPSASSSRKRP